MSQHVERVVLALAETAVSATARPRSPGRPARLIVTGPDQVTETLHVEGDTLRWPWGELLAGQDPQAQARELVNYFDPDRRSPR